MITVTFSKQQRASHINTIALSWVFLFAASLYGCKTSVSPSTTSSDMMLSGVVAQLDTLRSGFDTAIWLPSVGTTVHLLSPDSTHQTNTQSWYEFDWLKNSSDYTLSIDRSGYAPVTVIHANDLNSYPERPTNLSISYAAFNVLLVPNSWLAVTIDNFTPNTDTSIISKRVGVQTDGRGDTTNFGTVVSDTQSYPSGLYSIAHIRSTRPDKSSLGYVFLYISRNAAIDPTNPSTYDMVFVATPVKDSSVKVILPQNIGSYSGVNYPSGSHVYCKAFASPFPHTPQYRSLIANRPVISGLGEYPSNTVMLTIP